MNIYRYIYAFIWILTLITSCGSVPEKMMSDSDMGALTERIEGKSFQLEADWAFPLMTQGISGVLNSGLFLPGSNANRINLMGNTNYFKVEGDSLSVYLPYFGERQMGGGYGTMDASIAFRGKPTSYKVSRDQNEKYLRIEIQATQKIETFRFYLTLFPSGQADINVNSSHRTSIRYSGRILPENEGIDDL